MRETPLSNVEKTFLLNCIQKNLRLDGRKLDEFRQLEINFGSDWGCALVSLGETRVLAQVSCELGEPKLTRPNEGLLYINVDLGPMAATHFEAGRNSDTVVQINRILERTFKDSRCVDLESLCIISEDRVWVLRVAISVLNYEGNIADCASVATLCALAHFKRPDVTVSGNEVKIHEASEKEPIPIVLHHYPICISFATFHNGEKAVADPSLMEEKTSETSMIFGFNSYRELCCINLGGTTLTTCNLLLQCAHQAANRARDVVEQIKAELEKDSDARLNEKPVGFAESLRLGRIIPPIEDRLSLKLPNFDLNDAKIKKDRFELKSVNDSTNLVQTIDDKTGILNSDQLNVKWLPESDAESDSDVSAAFVEDHADTSESMNEDDVKEAVAIARTMQQQQQQQQETKRKKPRPDLAKRVQAIEISSDSEEDTTIILN